MKQYKAAVKAYKRSLKYGSDSYAVWHNLAAAYDKLGKERKAARTREKARKLR